MVEKKKKLNLPFKIMFILVRCSILSADKKIFIEGMRMTSSSHQEVVQKHYECPK